MLRACSAVLLLISLFTASLAQASLEEELRKQLLPLVNEASAKYGTAYSLGFSSANVSLELVAGAIDSINAKTGSAAQVGDSFAWGSVTKTVTGAGILQLAAAGKLKLSDRAEKYVDPMLKLAKAPYDSLQDFFQADRWGIPPAVQFNASEITIRHLLAMLSGIRDFDTNGYRDFQYESPHLDTSPLQILDWVHGPLMFKPGGPIPTVGHRTSSMNYCSVNFILLGYILAYFSGSQTWAEYDQSSVMPAAVRKRMPGLKFPKSGPCSHFTRVHGYDQASRYAPYDVSNTSCLGGWTAGNIVMPSLAAAEWTRSLWGTSYEVIPAEYVQEMTRFTNGSFYGLATMNMSQINGISFLGPYGDAVGHLGDTYGFTSLVSYFPKLDVGLAIATNHESQEQPGARALLCTAYNRAVDIMRRQPIRKCAYVHQSYWESGCNCSSDFGSLRTEILI